MKRDILKLKQKLMQRFLDGGISQETYDSMMADLERMGLDAATCDVQDGFSAIPVPFPAQIPDPFPQNFEIPAGRQENPLVVQTIPARILPSAQSLEMFSSRGRKLYSAALDSANIPSPEVPDVVLDVLKPGEPLDIHWIYPMTRDCAIAWQGTGVPVRLSLSRNVHLTDESMRFVGDIPNLERLNLTSTQVSDEGLHFLSALERLESLVLVSTHVRGDVFHELENLRTLRELVLTSSDFGNEGMESVGAMHALEELRLDDTAVSDDGIEALAGLTGLKLLNLQGALVSDKGLKAVAGLTELMELYIGGTILCNDLIYESPISNDGIQWLENLTELRILHLNDTQFDDTGVRYLRKMMSLRELNLSDTYLTDGCLAALSELPSLRQVMVDNTTITLTAIRKHFGHHYGIFSGFRTGTWDSVRDFLKHPWSQ